MGSKRKKIKEVSFYFSVVSEGYFPFLNKQNWPDREEVTPLNFYPTLESFLLNDEWKKYDFSEEEEQDILQKRGLSRIKHTPETSQPETKAERKEEKTKTNNEKEPETKEPKTENKQQTKIPTQNPKSQENEPITKERGDRGDKPKFQKQNNLF